MHPALYALISVAIISLISFVGILTLVTRLSTSSKFLFLLISFAAGALLGDVFIHILPELAADGLFNFTTSLCIMAAIVILFVIEKYVHWHHHASEHDEEKHAEPFVWTNLFGDALHNMIDGMVIAGAYLLDVRLGVATTIAVLLHEIPQEFADFGVLVYGGLTPARALFYNFLSAITSLIGVGIVLLLGTNEHMIAILAALGAGSFIYLAVADLIPEIHKEKENAFTQLLSFGLGIVTMFLLLYLK